MRIEVIVDDKTLERHEFICKPSPGETIELQSGRYVVDDFRHNIAAGRLQVICSKAGQKSQRPRTDQ